MIQKKIMKKIYIIIKIDIQLKSKIMIYKIKRNYEIQMKTSYNTNENYKLQIKTDYAIQIEIIKYEWNDIHKWNLQKTNENCRIRMKKFNTNDKYNANENYTIQTVWMKNYFIQMKIMKYK